MKTETPRKARRFIGAEREGFEPPVGSSPTTVFKTVAINRSAISPGANIETHCIMQNPEGVFISE